jgi:hypothetical protein
VARVGPEAWLAVADWDREDGVTWAC